MKNSSIPYPEIRILLYEFCGPIDTDIKQFCEHFVASIRRDFNQHEYDRFKKSIDWAIGNIRYDFKSLIANSDKTNQQIVSLIEEINAQLT